MVDLTNTDHFASQGKAVVEAALARLHDRRLSGCDFPSFSLTIVKGIGDLAVTRESRQQFPSRLRGSPHLPLSAVVYVSALFLSILAHFLSRSFMFPHFP